MAASAGWALQKGIYETLASNPDITGLLGGANIFDEVPQRTRYPYLTLGQTVERDWSTGSEEGTEHVVTLHVWSRAGGKRQAHEILNKIHEVLHDSLVALSDHHLVNLRQEYAEARQEADDETYHGIARFRTVTEPLS